MNLAFGPLLIRLSLDSISALFRGPPLSTLVQQLFLQNNSPSAKLGTQIQF